MRPCGACGGSGYRYGPRKIPCWRCHGAGEVLEEPQPTKETNMNIEEMRSEIERLTGKRPKSKDPRWLSRRLTQLKQPEVFSVSMSKNARAALLAMEAREGGGVSALIRKALGVYAAERGYEWAVAFAGENSEVAHG